MEIQRQEIDFLTTTEIEYTNIMENQGAILSNMHFTYIFHSFVYFTKYTWMFLS